MKLRLTLIVMLILSYSSISVAQVTISRTGATNYSTIQDAITAAIDGDIVQISAGVFDLLNTTLNVGKSLTFIGSGPSSSPTTIITSTATKIITLSATAKNFSFQNLMIEGNTSNNGIYAGSSIDIASLSMHDVVLRNCQVGLYLAENYPGGGPVTTTVGNLSFDNVTLTNNKFIGAYIGKTVLSGTVANSTITGNGYSNDLPTAWQKVGLQFVNFDEASLPHVEITNCYFYNNGAGASNIERTGLSMYTAYNALSANELMTVSGTSFVNHHWAVRIKNEYSVGNTATVNGTFSGNDLDIWFNSVTGTSSSTTLIRRTFPGIWNVGPGTTYDYNTIQDAITAAKTGDVINVAAATYDITTPIIISKSVSIIGAEGYGTVVRNTATNGYTDFEISASNITLQRLVITLSSSNPLPSPDNELNNSLVRIPASLNLTGIVISDNKFSVPVQSGAMSTWGHRAISVGSGGTSGLTISGNSISNVRNGIVLQYNNIVTINGNTIYNTKGGIMNYTNTQLDANNRTMSNNSWSTVHNEWDIVWNTAYYVPDYSQSVLALSGANNDAYVVDRRAANAAASSALIGNRSHVFVNSTTGTTSAGPTNGNPNMPYANLNLGIAAVIPGGTIYIANGNYPVTSSLNFNKALTLIGENEETVIIDGSGATSVNNFIDITAPNVVIKNLTIDGKLAHYTVWPPAKPWYGINISGTTPSNISIQDVTVKAFGKNGINLNGAANISFDDVTSINNGGAGFFIIDVHDINLNDITTSNNQWGGVGIATWGRYYAGGVDNIIFSGTNSFNESAGVQGGLYLEQGNYNNKANPFMISYSSNPADNANVTYLSDDFAYTLNGPQDDGDPVASDGYKRIRFYDSQTHAVTAAGTVYESTNLLCPGHFLDDGRYITKLSDGSLYIPAGLDIQDAVNAAQSGGVVNVASGTYPHIVIDKPLTLNGNGAIITNASPAITITSSNVTVTDFTFIFDDNTLPYEDYAIDVQNNATNVQIHGCNFQNTLNGANGNGVINRGTGTVDATFNYWNSLTGPTIASNLGGTGRIATNSGGGILYYTPWFGNYDHTITSVAQATLTSPANLSTGVSILPIFTWDNVIGVTYQLEIATDISFAASSIVFGPVTVTSPYQLPEAHALNNGTIYYCRITATVGSYSSVSVSQFTTILPVVPIQTYPGNATTVLGNIIYFSWYSGVAGVQYVLEVSPFSDFHQLVSGIPTTPSSILGYNLAYNYTTLPARQYYWRVKSYTTAGVLISISSAWTFVISGPPTAAPLYPVGGTTIYSTNSTIWWMPINYAYTSGIYYRVRYSTDHSFNLTSPVTTNLYTTLNGLIAGQTYYYVIDASTSSTDWSSATTSIEESFTVFYSTVSDILVYQSYPVWGATVYVNTPTLYWYIGMYVPGVTFDLEYFDGTWHSLGTVSNYYYTFPFALSSGSYSWRVRVSGSSTWYTESFVVYGTSSSAAAVIPMPLAPIGGTVVTTQSPELSWYAYSTTSLEYQVIYSNDPTMVGGVLSNTAAPNGGTSGWLVNSTYQLTGLTQGVTYYWQVCSRLASNPAVVSNYSSVGQFTVSPGAYPVVVIPANPIIGTNVNSTVANLSWILPAKSTSELSYELEISKEPSMQSATVISSLEKQNYTVNNLELNNTYYWRVKTKNEEGQTSNYSAVGSFTTGKVTDVEQETSLPANFELKQNYPNPFNPTTRIFYSLPEKSFVTLKVYDMLGREIKTLVNQEMNAGQYSVDWNAGNDNGEKITSGIYIYRISAGSFCSTKKMIFLK